MNTSLSNRTEDCTDTPLWVMFAIAIVRARYHTFVKVEHTTFVYDNPWKESYNSDVNYDISLLNS